MLRMAGREEQQRWGLCQPMAALGGLLCNSVTYTAGGAGGTTSNNADSISKSGNAGATGTTASNLPGGAALVSIAGESAGVGGAANLSTSSRQTGAAGGSGIATEAVNFATQVAKKLGVTQDLAKYNSALAKAKELASKAGVNLSDSQWETLLESAYKKAKDGLQPLQTGTITSDDITNMITTEVGKIVPNDTIVNLIQQELSKLSLSVNVAPAQQVTSASVSDSPTGVAS